MTTGAVGQFIATQMQIQWSMTLTDMRLTEFMGFMGKSAITELSIYLVNKLHDFTGMPDLSGNIYYDYFFRKTHARLYFE